MSSTTTIPHTKTYLPTSLYTHPYRSLLSTPNADSANNYLPAKTSSHTPLPPTSHEQSSHKNDRNSATTSSHSLSFNSHAVERILSTYHSLFGVPEDAIPPRRRIQRSGLEMLMLFGEGGLRKLWWVVCWGVGCDCELVGVV